MKRFIVLLAAVFLFCALAVVPALSHHKTTHDNGPKYGPSPTPTSSQPTHGCDQAKENDGDAYDSTCDGRPSRNGNGSGSATGRPCAGCVGAADNKNPAGQFPDGSDDNNGYECDGNSGVGKTNPAHTGCTTTPPPPTPTPTPTPTCTTRCPSPTPTPTPTITPCQTCPTPTPPCTDCVILPMTGRNLTPVILVGLLLIALGAVAYFTSKH